MFWNFLFKVNKKTPISPNKHTINNDEKNQLTQSKSFSKNSYPPTISKSVPIVKNNKKKFDKSKRLLEKRSKSFLIQGSQRASSSNQESYSINATISSSPPKKHSRNHSKDKRKKFNLNHQKHDMKRLEIAPTMLNELRNNIHQKKFQKTIELLTPDPSILNINMIISDWELWEIFEDFCFKDYCKEAAMFLTSVKKLSKVENLQDKINGIIKIQEKFIGNNAELQLNIDSQLTKSILAEVAHLREISSCVISQNSHNSKQDPIQESLTLLGELLQRTENETKHTLCDTYMRFYVYVITEQKREI